MLRCCRGQRRDFEERREEIRGLFVNYDRYTRYDDLLRKIVFSRAEKMFACVGEASSLWSNGESSEAKSR